MIVPRSARANAADTDHLKGDILERISVEQVKPVGLEAILISLESPLGIEVVASIACGREMIDQRRSVLDPGLFVFYQMGKVVILGESVARFSENGLQFAAQRAAAARNENRQLSRHGVLCFDHRSKEK
jgi:hypothetical protein